MNKNSKIIISEFKKQGASDRESNELFLFSKNLSNLYKNVERSAETKEKFLKSFDKPLKTSNFYSKLSYAFPILVLFFVIFTHVASAMQEGQALYPVKKLSTQVYSYVKDNLIKEERDTTVSKSEDEQNSSSSARISEEKEDSSEKSLSNSEKDIEKTRSLLEEDIKDNKSKNSSTKEAEDSLDRIKDDASKTIEDVLDNAQDKVNSVIKPQDSSNNNQNSQENGSSSSSDGYLDNLLNNLSN